MNNTSRIHTWQEKCCVLSISPYLVRKELCPVQQSLPARVDCVLSTSPYLAGWGPIHQSIPGWVRAVSYPPVPTWLGGSCVLSTSPYLAGWGLCPIHQSMPARVGAVSYPPVHTWLLCPIHQSIPGCCVQSTSPYLPGWELCPIHQSIPGWVGPVLFTAHFKSVITKNLGHPTFIKFCPVLEIALLRRWNSVPNHKYFF